jgi:hypothetical protein
VSGTTISGNTAFHKGNDGSGSGLDADSVRGQFPSDLGGSTRSNMDSFINNMNNIASSGGAMNDVINRGLMANVVASESAMQDVANSGTAMNQVTNSKAAISEVVASKRAMNIVANSGTGMQAMAQSSYARSLILSTSTPFNSTWTKSNASRQMLKALSPTPPHNYSGSNVSSSIVNTPFGNGKALEIDINEETDSEFHGGTFSLDLAGVSTLSFAEKLSSEGFSNNTVIVDGNELFNETTSNNYTIRSLDVSDFSTVVNVSIGTEESGGGRTRNAVGRFTRIQLS